MGLLLPAIQKVREAANRMVCGNNLKQIGIGYHNYLGVNEAFPIGWGDTNNPETGGKTRGGQGVFASILPYLEEQNLARLGPLELTSNYSDILSMGFAEETFGLINCPSDSRILKFPKTTGWKGIKKGLTSYMGVSGSDSCVEDGMFHDNSAIEITEISDGTSNTLAVGERPPPADLSLGGWYWGPWESVMSTRNVCFIQHHSSGAGGKAPLHLGYNATCTPTGECVVIANEEQPNAPGYPCKEKAPHMFRPGRIDDYCDANHFWSLHPGGGNWLFGDGSVRFLAYEVAAITPSLSTIAGGEIIPKGFEY